MKRYAKYKDSSISWIGKIPIQWELKKIKFLFTIGRGRVIATTELSEDGRYPVFSSQTENNGCMGYLDTFDFDSEQLTWTTDGANAGTVFRREGRYNCTNVCGTLKLQDTTNNSLRYFEYAVNFVAPYNKRRDTNGYKIMNNEMAKIIVAVPKLCEQLAIATYLDHHTAEIDKLLADLQSQADLLDRYKRQLIVDAVTHGIDKTVSRKDSGVDWIGKVPTDWMVVPLRAVAKDNSIKNDGMQCDNLLSLSYGKIIRKDIDTNFGLLPESFEGYQIVQAGYTVLRLTDLQNDKRSLRTGYVSETGIITSAYTGLIPSKQIDDKYFTYLLHVYDLKKIYYGLGGGVRQSLKYSDLKTLPILIPPISDQRAIVAYINDKTTQVDGLIADINKQIEKLKQYRQIVIHDAVTGKIKVKEKQDNGN